MWKYLNPVTYVAPCLHMTNLKTLSVLWCFLLNIEEWLGISIYIEHCYCTRSRRHFHSHFIIWNVSITFFLDLPTFITNLIQVDYIYKVESCSLYLGKQHALNNMSVYYSMVTSAHFREKTNMRIKDQKLILNKSCLGFKS